MKYSATVLVVEDDLQILDFIAYALKKEGLDFVGASRAQEAMQKLSSKAIDIVILELELPDANGMEAVKYVRQWSVMPIIVLSARGRDADKVNALDGGADDYLTKPFSVQELMARIRVALRHIGQQRGQSLQLPMTVGGLQIDMDKRLVQLDGKPLHLTPTEYKLLCILFINAGKVLTKKQIIAEIWGPFYGTNTQTLRVLVAGLRKKIEKNPPKPRYILTEVGVGYKLTDK